jgi:hypothetical protein
LAHWIYQDSVFLTLAKVEEWPVLAPKLQDLAICFKENSDAESRLCGLSPKEFLADEGLNRLNGVGAAALQVTAIRTRGLGHLDVLAKGDSLVGKHCQGQGRGKRQEWAPYSSVALLLIYVGASMAP